MPVAGERPADWREARGKRCERTDAAAAAIWRRELARCTGFRVSLVRSSMAPKSKESALNGPRACVGWREGGYAVACSGVARSARRLALAPPAARLQR